MVIDRDAVVSPDVVYQGKELLLKICLEKWKIRELLRVVTRR